MSDPDHREGGVTPLREFLTDLRVGLTAFGILMGRWLSALPGILRWRVILRPVSAALATAMTLAIPLLAINGELARAYFPPPYVDLWSAGRQPNIQVLAADGTPLGSRGSDLGDIVRIDELPPYVIDAILSTEDRRFYQHPGFDPAALLRATLTNWSARGVVQGGSTITQQLAKNLFLSGEQTITRKLQELHLALWLEARLSKREILELYINRIYLGANTYGLSAASEAYFSKPPTELTLGEAAVLAGLPKAPSTLAPHVNFEGALKRSHEVISNLVETGKIDPLTAKIAEMAPPSLALRDARDGYGYFLDHVAAELRRRFPELDSDIVVTTTLQPGAQQAAEAAVKQVLSREDAAARGARQAALIAYDPTGGITAMVGGTSYRMSQFNRTTQARRQPGSAFKPFVYLAAIEAGFDPDTVLVDAPVSVDGWSPRNYKKRHLGHHRLREAFARSSNTATVQVSEAIGRDAVIEAAQRAGLDARMEPYPTLPLGVFEVSLADLTAAYLPLAYGGYGADIHAIRKITSRGGKLLYEREPTLPPRLISARSAEKMTGLLRSVTTSGTGRTARIPGHDIAGKTGTTDDWRDAWFVGFTAHLTAGVWVGNDENEPMTNVSGATLPARIWSLFMADAHDAMGAEPVRLTSGSPSTDPTLIELRATYISLQNELARRMDGVPVRPQQRRFDGIRGLLQRERRQRPAPETIEGRIIRPGAEDSTGNSPAAAPMPGARDRVRGRIVREDDPES